MKYWLARNRPIAELELELKAGRPAAVLAIGAALAQEFPLLVEPRSKFAGIRVGWVGQ